MTKGIQCYRCGRRSPKASITYIHNTPLGPTCVETLRIRGSLRGSGLNAKMIETSDKLVVMTSDVCKSYCPDEDIHCIQCPYFSDQRCPLEIGIETEKLLLPECKQVLP